MIVPQKLRLKNTIKYPTSLIIGGLNKLGLEIAESLIKQGGYVIIVDSVTNENLKKFDSFDDNALISFLDFTSIPHLEEDVRRLDYVFYFAHESLDFRSEISTQEFLTFSNYLDAALSTASKFDARFLITTSIKAHQIYYSEHATGFDINMGSKLTQTYNDMEVQRYAEGLVMEYVQKADLNARIIRLGELIGDGIDLRSNTAFINLLTYAVKGEKLYLRNDGLETEWFVHIMDAAYALIKAQFSKGTLGQIYSVCFENTYTHLSVAYKIQEVDENVKEIQFIEEANNLPPLKIHKPAPNLSKIGWMPRVSFDKAVSQSLAAAKVHFLEKKINQIPSHTSVPVQTGDSLIDKVKGFLNIAEEKEEIVEIENSPVARLIEQRKREEELKRQKLYAAGKTLKFKKHRRPRTFGEKIQNFFWSIFAWFGNRFKFVQQKSPLELGLLAFGIVTLVFLFFTILSPLLVIFRNAMLIVPAYTQSINAAEKSDFASFRKSSAQINESLKSTNDLLPRFNGVFNLFSLGEEYQKLQGLLKNYETYAAGVNDLSYATEPFNEYLDVFENNTQIRNTTDSYLSLTNDGTDYSSIVNKISEREAYFESGLQKLQRAQSNLVNTEYDFLPNFASEFFLKQNQNLTNVSSRLTKLTNYKFLPEFLGSKGAKTYLIVVLENTRPKFIGGDISSYALVTLNNGSVQEIKVQSTESLDLSLTPDEDTLNSINATRFNLLEQNSIDFNEFSTISNISDFSNLTAEVFGANINRSIDGVLTLNLNALESIIQNYSEGREIDISGVSFSSGDFLSNISATQVGNQTIRQRKEVISQILAYSLNNILESLKNKDYKVFGSIEQLINSQDITFSTTSLSSRRFITDTNLDLSAVGKSDNFVKVGLNLNDDKLVNLDRYPNLNLALETEIKNDYSIQNNLNITFPNFGTAQEVSVCLPANTLVNSIKIDERSIPSNRITINTDSDDVCVAAQIVSETQMVLNWVNRTNISESTEEVTLNLAVAKVNGAVTTLDYKIIAESPLKIDHLSIPLDTSQNSIVFSNTILKDLIFKLTLKK